MSILSSRKIASCLAYSLTLGLASTLLPACASDSSHATEEIAIVHSATPEQVAATHSTEPIQTREAVLYVNGLGCPLCASNIDKQLLRVKGVESAVVNLGEGTVLLSLGGKTRPSPHDLSESVLDAGFTLVRIQTR